MSINEQIADVLEKLQVNLYIRCMLDYETTIGQQIEHLLQMQHDEYIKEYGVLLKKQSHPQLKLVK